MSRKDKGRNNKLNKIITRLGDIKLDTIMPESGYDDPSQEKEEAPKINEWSLSITLAFE